MSDFRTVRIDRDTAERLLNGVPAALRASGPLGEHLAAAAAPAYRYELAGRSAALAAFRAAQLLPATEQRRPSMIKTWLAKMLTVKAAALLAVTAAGGVALAATTGALPTPLTDRPSVTDVPHSSTRPSTPASHPAGGPSTLPSPSLVGLCHAYTAGAGSDHGKALDSPAFTALITAAGGRDKVAAFCAATLASAPGRPTDGPSPKSSHPAGPPSGQPNASGHPTGAPTSHPSGTPSHPGGH
jgi:hypothetical protein